MASGYGGGRAKKSIPPTAPRRLPHAGEPPKGPSDGSRPPDPATPSYGKKRTAPCNALFPKRKRAIPEGSVCPAN